MKSAMIYPIAVLGIAGSVIVLLLWKVVPIFTQLFNGLGVDLPLPTRVVIGLSNFVGSIYGAVIVVSATGGVEVGTEKVWDYAADRGIARRDRGQTLRQGHPPGRRRQHPRRRREAVR